MNSSQITSNESFTKYKDSNSEAFVQSVLYPNTETKVSALMFMIKAKIIFLWLVLVMKKLIKIVFIMDQFLLLWKITIY